MLIQEFVQSPIPITLHIIELLPDGLIPMPFVLRSKKDGIYTIFKIREGTKTVANLPHVVTNISDIRAVGPQRESANCSTSMYLLSL